MTLVRLNKRDYLPGRNHYHGMDDAFSWFLNESKSFGGCTNLPSANIIETGEDFRVEMAVPGFRKDDFNIRIENNILSVSHESEGTGVNENEKFVSREFSKGGFSRNFRLSNRLDTDNIKARYKSGILTILIPKKEEAKEKPVREIAIS